MYNTKKEIVGFVSIKKGKKMQIGIKLMNFMKYNLSQDCIIK
jgi:hypothetical protein